MNKRVMHKLFTLFFLLVSIGCSSDIALVDQKKDHVVIDSFIQPHQLETVDVLIVLDTSGSMHDDVIEVGTGIEIFRTDIEGLTTDYRFSFITTDANNLGYNGYYDATSSSIDIMLAPGILPSASGEAGYEAAYIFMNNDDGIDFRREGADFLLFLISDEDEQSSITSPLFRDWLYDFFPNVRHDVVAITTYEDSICATWDIGYKYIELANLYNKDAIDICDEGWSAWLSESSFLTQLKDYMELSQTPIEDSIVVYINQVITNEWTYSSEKNTVYLTVMPSYGSIIEVGYEVED